MKLPHRRAEGRERVRAPRRGRGAERSRHAEVGQAPAAGHQGRRLVGAHPRRGCARQDRRAAGRRRRHRADPRRGRGRPPRRHRDPQPDQGRARRQPPDRGHQGQGLVGQRTRRGCAGRNRQQEGRAAADGAAAGRTTRGRCRRCCARLGKLGDTSVHRADAASCSTGPRRRSRIEAINALARLADDKRADTCALHLQAQQANNSDDRPSQHAAMRALRGARQPLLEHRGRSADQKAAQIAPSRRARC